MGEIIMLKTIVKRDGNSQKFVPFKIEDVIKKAFESEVKTYDKDVFAELMNTIKNRDEISVEEVQDIIEKVLYAHGHFEVMKSFMLYRHMHKIQREQILICIRSKESRSWVWMKILLISTLHRPLKSISINLTGGSRPIPTQAIPMPDLSITQQAR
jgi:hypothetical protein